MAEFVKIPLLPGVYKDDTPAVAEGYFIDSNWVRFDRARAQTMGGWEKVSETQMSGLCRGLHSYAATTGEKWLGIGTHTNLYALSDGIVYDITPIVERGQLSNPFSTTNLSTSVNVNDTAHGRLVGDGVNFSNASAVGGLTISGNYTVTTVVDADNYTITAASAATSTAGPGGGTVSYKYYLAIGLADSLGGAGYGTGGYGVGGYGSSSATDFQCRIWSIDNYGQNQISCVRGGAIYEWAPLTSASELVTNGSFATPTDWTPGAGWTLTATNATSTLSNAALSQAVLCEPMAYFVLECDVTRSAGSLQITLNSVNVGAAISASANIQRTVYPGNAGGSLTLAFTGTGFTGTIDNVTLKQMMNAEAMTNAPTQNIFTLVTPEGFVMSLGTVEVATGNFNPLHIRWSDIAPNHHTWTPSSTVQSGFWTLGNGSRIIGGLVTETETLIWTDTAIYAAVYTNNGNNPYIFQSRGTGCGLIGPHAATDLNGVVYWMSPAGCWFRYAGGKPSPVDSSMHEDVFQNIAPVQQDKIFAGAIGSYQDVMFGYPDQRDGTNEISRYALLNSTGGTNGAPCWANGETERTAWIDAGIETYPVAVDADGYAYFHEKGSTADGAPLSWHIETGLLKIGNGNTLQQVNSLVPDFKNFQGGLTWTAYSYMWPQSSSSEHGPFNVNAASEKIDVLSDAPVGRLVAHKFAGDAAPAGMRTGELMMEIEDTGMAF